MSSSCPEMVFILTAHFQDNSCTWAFKNIVSFLGGWGRVGFQSPLGRGSLCSGESPIARLVENFA